MPKSKSHKMKKGQWGGNANNAAPVAVDSSPSAGNYLLSVVGDGWTQFTNALTLNPAQGPVASSQTAVVPIANPNANVSNYDKSLGQSGGKRRGKGNGKGRGRKGGFLGAETVVGQAIVPLALVGMQHTYAKRHKRGGKHTRRHSRKH
jgi:hypothetical protein